MPHVITIKSMTLTDFSFRKDKSTRVDFGKTFPVISRAFLEIYTCIAIFKEMSTANSSTKPVGDYLSLDTPEGGLIHKIK